MGWGDSWGDNWGGGDAGGGAGSPEVTVTPASPVFDQASYARAFWLLLPPGQAFDRSSPNLNSLIFGLAAEFVRIEQTAIKIPYELNPLNTTAFIVEWEAFAGLPDKCAGTVEDTLQGRRAAVVSKVSSTGGQSLKYYEDVAQALGYTVTCTNTAEPYVWQVNAPTTTVTYFRAGQSRAGERVRTWGNDVLECKINQIKPAHTRVVFAYA